MSEVITDPVRVVRHISNLRGSSRPVLVEASDGAHYVLKFSNSPHGPNMLFHESMGTELYHAYGLLTPAWKPLLLTEEFLRENPGCWMQTQDETIRPDAGLCFGSRFLGAHNVRLLEVLPGNGYLRVQNRLSFWLAWALDICIRHADNRQAIFIEQPSREIQAVFIDHGHILGGENHKLKPHVLASRYLDPRIYPFPNLHDLGQLKIQTQGVDVEKVWKQAQELPSNWVTSANLYQLGRCLNNLATYNYVADILDKITEAAQAKDAEMLPLRVPPPYPLCAETGTV